MERPNIQNDLVTLNHKMAGDPLIKLSIAHALAQARIKGPFCFSSPISMIVQFIRSVLL